MVSEVHSSLSVTRKTSSGDLLVDFLVDEPDDFLRSYIVINELVVFLPVLKVVRDSIEPPVEEPLQLLLRCVGDYTSGSQFLGNPLEMLHHALSCALVGGVSYKENKCQKGMWAVVYEHGGAVDLFFVFENECCGFIVRDLLHYVVKVHVWKLFAY